MNANLLFGCGLGGSLLLVGCGEGKADNAASSHKPNVVFIVADDLGYGDLSCYGASANSYTSHGQAGSWRTPLYGRPFGGCHKYSFAIFLVYGAL